MTKMMQLQPMPTKKMSNVLTAGAGRLARAFLTGVSLALSVGVLTTGVVPAHAEQGGLARRTIEGRVQDRNDAPLRGAIVYLKDSRTLAVKSFISDDEGTFRFGQLSQNTDYEIYAEFQGKRSKSRNISSFDNKNDFNFTLKIDVGK